MTINYNNRRFKPIKYSENGETSEETIFKYKQKGNILTSSYDGGQIEDALQSKKTWTDWKNNIINKYSNGTESKLHDCFNHWNTN